MIKENPLFFSLTNLLNVPNYVMLLVASFRKAVCTILVSPQGKAKEENSPSASMSSFPMTVVCLFLQQEIK